MTKTPCRATIPSVDFILFDLDGTLVDSSQGIFRSFRYAFERQGLPSKSDDELKECVGPPLLDSFLRFHGGDLKKAEEGVKAYRERYAVLGYGECSLYAGCKEGLSALKAAGKTLALATSKPLVFAEKILKDKGIYDLFSVVVGSKLDNSFDKKADIIAEAMRRLHAKKEFCTMVGDRRQDGEGARASLSWVFAAGSRKKANSKTRARNISPPILPRSRRIFCKKLGSERAFLPSFTAVL